MTKALTFNSIEAAKAASARREIPDGLLAGLYLIVQPTGVKSWAVRYRAGGRTRKLTLGAYPGITLKAARELAQGALRSVAEGKDPGIEKKAARRADARAGRDTIAALAAEFVVRQAKAKRRDSTVRETERILNVEIIPSWGARQASEITKRDVIELLDKIVDRGAPIQANRVLAAIRRMFNWCIERDILSVSPCAGVKAPSAESSRERTLSDVELRLLWNACETAGWPFGRLFQMLILTGQRRDEVAAARWQEFDLDGALWSLPRERVKNDRSHQVPLSPSALEILNSLPVIGARRGCVFTLGDDKPVSGFSRAKERVEQLMIEAAPKGVVIERWTLHDVRRTVASGMARLGFPVHVVEAVLNHKSGMIKGVAAVYNRYDYAAEKRQALEAWAREVERVVRGATIAKISPIQSAKCQNVL